MKYYLLAVMCFLAILAIVAYALVPDVKKDGKIPLVWTTDANPVRGDQVDRFNELNPDCRLRIDPDNTGVMKVIVQSCAGMGPDLIDGISDGNSQTYYEAGILWDITEQAKKMGFGLDTLPESVKPLVTLKVPGENGKMQERQFMYPCNVFHTYIFFNKNLFDQYGVSYPSKDLTWEEYIEKAGKMTIREEGDSFPRIFGASAPSLITVIWEKGGAFMNEDGTRCILNSPEAAEALMFWHELFYKYKIAPTPGEMEGINAQGGWGSNLSWFAEGKVAMIQAARYTLIQFRRFILEQRKEREKWLKEHPGAPEDEAPEILQIGACLPPRFADGRRYTRFGARCTGINKASPHREEALKFMQYLASPEYSRTINQGADSKPGNKKYHTIEDFRHPDFPGEEEVHRIALEIVPYGRTVRRSFFISMARIMRAYSDMKSKLINDKELTLEEAEYLLSNAQEKINSQIEKNIKRNDYYRDVYEKMIAAGAEPAAFDMKETN